MMRFRELLRLSLFVLPVLANLSLAADKTGNMEFVPIPAGEFQMGCSPGDTECGGEEKPAHRVQITKAFEIGKYELTRGNGIG